MKVSKVLLVGLTGVSLLYAIKRMLSRKKITAVVNEIVFDTEFIPGTGTINQFVADNPEMRNWFRTRQTLNFHDNEETLFI